MARKGKRERVIEARQSIITQNQAHLDAAKGAPRRVACGPMGFKASSRDHRTALKRQSGFVGFVGPRGFFTPKDYVHKQEATPGAIGPYATKGTPVEPSRDAKTFPRWTDKA